MQDVFLFHSEAPPFILQLVHCRLPMYYATSETWMAQKRGSFTTLNWKTVT